MRLPQSDTGMMAVILAAVIAAGGALALVVALLMYPFMSVACAARWNTTFETEYGIFSGCRIDVDGTLIPEDSWRLIEE